MRSLENNRIMAEVVGWLVGWQLWKVDNIHRHPGSIYMYLLCVFALCSKYFIKHNTCISNVIMYIIMYN